MKLDFAYLVFKITLIFKSHGTEKNRSFLPKEIYDFQNLGSETLVTADYKYITLFSFGLLDLELLIKEDTLCINLVPVNE